MLHDFTQHSAFASINIYHLPWQLSSLQRKSRRVLKKEVKSDSKKLFLGIPWRNNPGQYVKQQYFYLPRGILCLESTRLHWFLFRALYVIKKHHLRFVFFILYLLSFFKLRICLVAVWRCSSAGVRASSGSPITSPSHPATWNFWMLCSPTGWKVRQSPRVEVLPSLVFTRLLCVCVHKLGPLQLQQSLCRWSPSLSRAQLKTFFVAGAILKTLDPVFSLESAALKSLGLHMSSRLSFRVLGFFLYVCLGFF